MHQNILLLAAARKKQRCSDQLKCFHFYSDTVVTNLQPPPPPNLPHTASPPLLQMSSCGRRSPGLMPGQGQCHFYAFPPGKVTHLTPSRLSLAV